MLFISKIRTVEKNTKTSTYEYRLFNSLNRTQTVINGASKDIDVIIKMFRIKSIPPSKTKSKLGYEIVDKTEFLTL